MIIQILLPEIKELLDKRDFATIKEVLMDWNPADVADFIKLLGKNEKVLIFRILPKEYATDVFEYLDIDLQLDLIKTIGHSEITEILNEMDPDDRTSLFEEIPAQAAKQLIMNLSHEERVVAQKLLGYPENSVGRLMTPEYISIREQWTINEVFKFIRENGKKSETLEMIYVIDEKGKLLDDIKIIDILLAQPDAIIKDLMDENFIYLNVNDDQETALHDFKKYDRNTLPVTDSSGILIGIVTSDDILDVAEEEATEDIHKGAAVRTLEEPYHTTSLFEMVKKRVSWLSILFLSEMLTTTAMQFFESELSKAVILAVFIPLIISSGGNSGSQASTLVIRALALREISIKDWFKVFRKEIITGLLLGIILGMIGFIRVSAAQMITGSFGIHWLLIAATIAVSIIGVVAWGTLMGSMLPLIIKKLGFDPATSSAPFVATLVDVTGLIIYFSVAMLVLRGSLL
ncbi:MAG: magnesium transporter [Bacteroidetes bacterium]|nr:MAG: magnesium transporter [Bacteroidota bacterium]